MPGTRTMTFGLGSGIEFCCLYPYRTVNFQFFALIFGNYRFRLTLESVRFVEYPQLDTEIKKREYTVVGYYTTHINSENVICHQIIFKFTGTHFFDFQELGWTPHCTDCPIFLESQQSVLTDHSQLFEFSCYNQYHNGYISCKIQAQPNIGQFPYSFHSCEASL